MGRRHRCPAQQEDGQVVREAIGLGVRGDRREHRVAHRSHIAAAVSRDDRLEAGFVERSSLRVFGHAFSVNQFISVGLVLGACFFIAWPRRRPRQSRPMATPRANALTP